MASFISNQKSTREHLSMQCSMIKGLDVEQARCAHTLPCTHSHITGENVAGPGKHCLCSFASLELTHKERTQPINNKQQHNHFCFGGRSAQDSKAGLDHQWEKGSAITTVASLSSYKFKGEGGTAWSTSTPLHALFKKWSNLSSSVHK